MIFLRSDLISSLSREFPHFNEAAVIAPLVKALFAQIRLRTRQGHSVHVCQFGRFVPVTRKPRQIMSLSGEKVPMLRHKTVKLNPGAYFRNELNNLGRA